MRARSDRAPVLVTGGCGFIGCNIVAALADRGDRVLVLDSLARDGAHENAHWLKSRHGDRIEIRVADIRDPKSVASAVASASAVLHLAGQVAVTSSLEDPVHDFEVNARGTLNVLEALRTENREAPLVFASTNKVYGALFGSADVQRVGERYVPLDIRWHDGIDETTPLDFYSPYGCSKGTADQYVRDYARVYGLRTAVLRMSCIYGPRQFGTEDQGWIAHFFLQAIRGEALTIYGDGYQVRDALHVDDAAAAWLAVLDNIDLTAGRVFNLGGGPNRTISLRELLAAMATMDRHVRNLRCASWRPGDQPWYVSNITALCRTVGWEPRVTLSDGLRSLDGWLTSRFGSPPAQEMRA